MMFGIEDFAYFREIFGAMPKPTELIIQSNDVTMIVSCSAFGAACLFVVIMSITQDIDETVKARCMSTSP